MSERKECCDTCRFWWKNAIEIGLAGDITAPCRRSPPQIVNHVVPVLDAKPDARVFPQTFSDDWCGEYKPDTAAAEADPVSTLRLSVRASKCVQRLGVRTIGELAALSDEDILVCPNTGATTLAEIRARLAERGLG